MFEAYKEGQGGIIEMESFGKVEKEGRDEMEQYRTYGTAINIVKESQPWEDPSDPEPRFANDLHASLAEAMSIDDYSKLKFYTAVGSALDHFHQIDAFFEIDDGDSIPKVITLDITINSEKAKHEAEYKADVIIQIPAEGLDPQIKEDKKQYDKKLKEVVKDILYKLGKKYKLKTGEKK